MSHVVNYGSSVFEGVRCYALPGGPAIFRAQEHMQRLLDSAKIYRMEYALDLAGWQTAVLETIRAGAPISRAEISRRAGISKPTVSLALQSLVESGLVREAEDGPVYPILARFHDSHADADAKKVIESMVKAIVTEYTPQTPAIGGSGNARVVLRDEILRAARTL